MRARKFLQGMDVKITDKMIERLEFEPVVVALEACEIVLEDDPFGDGHDPEVLLEIVMFLSALGKTGAISYDADAPEIVDGVVEPYDAKAFIKLVATEQKAVHARTRAMELQRELEQRFSQKLKGTFGYEFTDGDFKRVQELVNELRDLMTHSEGLSEEHKRRLLARLEQVQRELNKKTSTLDHLYALAIEASIVAGKVGQNSLPLIKAAKELMGISWRTHTHTEGLPSGTEAPVLGYDGDLPKLG